MPRCCAVKICKNRTGTPSRQENKRISIYPFPLQDKPRLQKWMNNMHRKDWSPSRHQYLCSEHFTNDCFDIRWGIRYLKNTAIPTIFPPIEDDKVRKNTAPMTRPCSLENSFKSSNSKTHFILRRTKNNSEMRIKNGPERNNTCNFLGGIFQLPLSSNTNVSCLPNASQSATCEVAGDTVPTTAPCLALSPCIELHFEGQPDSTMTVLWCESDEEAAVDTSGSVSPVSSLTPMEVLKAQSNSGSFLQEMELSEGESICVLEHSYSRPNPRKDQLRSKVVSLHAKILELDHREECTVVRINALENEIALLKRDGSAFREKQKILENYISSLLL